MPAIGMKELQGKAGDVLRQVREEQREFLVTDQGEPVAFLSPIARKTSAEAATKDRQPAIHAWEAYQRLAAASRDRWPAECRVGAALAGVRS